MPFFNSIKRKLAEVVERREIAEIVKYSHRPEPLINILVSNRRTGTLIKLLEPQVGDIRIPGKVSEIAAKALGNIGDPEAVEPLIAALDDTNSYVHRSAAEALGKIGDIRAVEPLILAWQNRGEGAAAEALGKLRDARAVEPLITSLRAGVNYACMQDALRNIGVPAIEPLVAELESGEYNANMLEAAGLVLNALGWQPGDDETGAAYWAGLYSWDRCVEMGTLAVKPLIVLLGASSSDDRTNAAQALGEIGDARAVEPLTLLLADTHPKVRQAAAEALGCFEDEKAAQALIAVKSARSGEETLAELCAYQPELHDMSEYMFPEYQGNMLASAINDFKAAGDLGSLVLAQLITRLSNKRDSRIHWAYEVARKVTPSPALSNAIQEARSRDKS